MNLHLLLSEHGWQTAGWTMVYYLALGSLVALLAAALRWLLRSADPTLRYATSLAVFAALALMPVGIVIWLSQIPAREFPLIKVAPAPQVIDLAITPLETNSQFQTPATLPSSGHESVTAWTTAHAIEYLPWVWLTGTPLTFLLLATGLLGAERLRRTSRIVTEGPVHDAGARLRAALGVGRRVTLAICDRLATPLMVGIVRPLILLPPAALTGWSADELEMVLLHELAHVRRWDNLVNLLQRVVESLLFFHPAVWLVSRWVRLDREDCCDAVVVSHTAKPQAYAELLVTLASTSHPLAGLAMARHPLAGRIRRILHLEDETMLVSRNTLVAISTALLAVVLAVSFYHPQETKADEASKRFATEDTESTEEMSEEQKASRVVPDLGAPDVPSPSPAIKEQRAADVIYKLQQQIAEIEQAFSELEIGSEQRAVRSALEEIHARKEHLLREREELVARTEQVRQEMAQLKREFSQLESGFEQREMLSALQKVHAQGEHFLRERVEEQWSRQQTTLLYDGKTFDQWRDAWERDLSVDVRIQAVQAFAAFANVGEGQQAAVDEILEIAGQYDWTSIGRNEFIQPLQETCIKAFTQQLPQEVAVEGILRAGDSENPRLQAFVPYVARQLSGTSKEANQAIREKFPDMKLPEFREGRTYGGERFGGF